MKYVVGMWIDHGRAVVVSFRGAESETVTVDSKIGKHVRAAGGGRGPTAYSPQDVVAEDRIDRRYHRHLQEYYARIQDLIGEPQIVARVRHHFADVIRHRHR
tara:strand:- start:165 stop:470 length:306 start_codon:yes stop_codon:yes gene_type:complete